MPVEIIIYFALAWISGNFEEFLIVGGSVTAWQFHLVADQKVVCQCSKVCVCLKWQVMIIEDNEEY